MSIRHLPPAVKQLLKLRNPNPRAGPPVAALNAVFNSTLQDAKRRNAETGWLVLSTCTLLTANIPPAVGHLYRFASQVARQDAGSSPSDPSPAIAKVAIMRESALKSSIFVGVPRTILSLAGLHEALEDDVKSGLRTKNERVVASDTIGPVLARGRDLWDSIYEPHAEKLYRKLESYHPDFMSFIIQAYGSVLAPLPGGDEIQGNLSRALGSVVGSACLRAEGRVGPQLTSHIFGLLKARDTEGLSDEDKWLSSDEGTEWVISTVDTLLDVLEADAAAPSAKL
ncbi:hypothetical protein PUNSTDRAFT_119355 [Punctularia strigosozonata HHB-11173 SS5]|uniref:uncharacterized protein n=1 Tax=Punctularia strigosozonata (strain HHB-11173) TaxID=741275 RepID=UPI000441769A|nr:uncharacterized protein PUNSTDRAFT_119355 [Punctularia strigosozonata HHB-11173 SS5]EIN10356.1 hypothetical protein PUNSTDRAFT_119355 [Punctularia strigosozonata HHB-11173 SS5]